ncbi:MAG: hypothetical protein F9K29_02515 [Hyphomicrobiaceae bacterium]|nr:MAG: hypothetical protein F9K29_02515 [Hyphomicrobiaceae bacterium]
MVSGLRKATILTLVVAAAAVFWSSRAAALTYDDILGTWCTAAGRSGFTRESLNIFRSSDSASFSFRITRYEFAETYVRVFWIRRDGAETSTTYGQFGADGRTMVQLATQESAERPHRRC